MQQGKRTHFPLHQMSSSQRLCHSSSCTPFYDSAPVATTTQHVTNKNQTLDTQTDRGCTGREKERERERERERGREGEREAGKHFQLMLSWPSPFPAFL